MSVFSAFLSSADSILSWIRSAASDFIGIFSDVDFTLLYDWLPSDIASAISSILVVFILIAVISLIKKLVIFLG